MIKPFVDAMSVSPEGGHALFNSNGNSGMEAESASASSPRLPATESSTSKTVAGQDIASNIKVPPPVTYSDNTVVRDFSLLFKRVAVLKICYSGSQVSNPNNTCPY